MPCILKRHATKSPFPSNGASLFGSQNHFDRLPDDLLRLILNRVLDAKSLCACLAVSTRLNSLALHSTHLSLSVDRIHFNDDDDSDDDSYDPPASKHMYLLRSLITLFIARPLRFLTRLASSRADSTLAAVFYSPTQALKSFSRIEILKIQLPSHGELQLDTPANPLLKWKASFGNELKTCVIVAGTSVDRIPNSDDDRRGRREYDSGIKEERVTTDGGGLERTAISNEDLKTRVVWTISCLIAASSRHHLLKRIVAEHPMLKAIEMVDEHHQGTLTMNEADISQMRRAMVVSDSNPNTESSVSSDRSRIPALKMKMWHAAELELPGCEKVMRGATLVVIGAADGVGEVVGLDGMFDGGEEIMYGEAAREIRSKVKQSYSLEMESF